MRDTTGYFETVANTDTGSDLNGSTISRDATSGSRGPIAQTLTSAGLLCPGSATTYCNAVSILDFHGRANSGLPMRTPRRT